MKRFYKTILLASICFIIVACTKSIEYKQQTTVMTNFAVPHKMFEDVPFAITPPQTNSTSPITYKSSDASVATVNGSTIKITGVGSTIITASQEASDKFTAAFITATLDVNTTRSSITGFTIGAKLTTDAPFVITAPKSNSAGNFTYESSNAAVATVSGNKITIKGAGTTQIRAEQAAAGNYGIGVATATLTVSAVKPTITGFTISAKLTTDAPFVLTKPTSNSKGAFIYTSSDITVATVSGDKVTIKGAGVAEIKAEQAAAGNYSAGAATATLTVTPPPPVYGSMTDVDGNVYKTVKIGKQTWMAENLKVTHYRDGAGLPNITDEKGWRNTLNGAWCDYKNDKSNGGVYGLLYNWYAIANTHQLAPKGWHIPTENEWWILYQNVGNSRETGIKMREKGTKHWAADIGTNETGFTALGGGGRVFVVEGEFANFGYWAYWWTATEKSSNAAKNIDFYVKGYFDFADKPKADGLSIRCIKD
ncbi:uncharacterized protein (TIGR02145 family) [Mucilaginibacter sp. UYP25]|uniref:FISUMP domain-containing protein n=1 Tax=unclassified Mucilaginibacter TaxID=2617802 RepID=UPI0033949617